MNQGKVILFPGVTSEQAGLVNASEAVVGVPSQKDLERLEYHVDYPELSSADIRDLMKSPEGRIELESWFRDRYFEYLNAEDKEKARQAIRDIEVVKSKLKGFLWKELRKLSMWIGLSLVVLSPQVRNALKGFMEDVAMQFVDEEGMRAYEDRTSGWDAMLDEWYNGDIDKSLSWDMERNLNIIAGTILAPILSLSSTSTKITALFTKAPSMVIYGVLVGIIDILVSVGGIAIPGITAIKGSFSLLRLMGIQGDKMNASKRLRELKSTVAPEMEEVVNKGLSKLEPMEIEAMIQSGTLDMDKIEEAAYRSESEEELTNDNSYVTDPNLETVDPSMNEIYQGTPTIKILLRDILYRDFGGNIDAMLATEEDPIRRNQLSIYLNEIIEEDRMLDAA